MAERIPAPLEEKFRKRLSFYQDMGIELFYRDRLPPQHGSIGTQQAAPQVRTNLTEEQPLPKPLQKTPSAKPAAPPPAPAPNVDVFKRPPGISLFESINKIAGDSLPKILADIGDCTRCRLHRGRTKLVFGDGNLQADLVFVGEGPGRDEDMQGLPFVGRAGKLLNQMIEAMGLQRKDVYICNVVKCRPPENRAPEKDEVEICSPFLLRQLDAIAPKVIVCLGSVAAQTLLQTNRGISHFRGEWQEFRGTKLMATYHPAYLLRNPSAKGEVWKDLQKVMAALGLQAKKSSSAGPATSPGKPS
jgi:DNA polymerase